MRSTGLLVISDGIPRCGCSCWSEGGEGGWGERVGRERGEGERGGREGWEGAA